MSALEEQVMSSNSDPNDQPRRILSPDAKTLWWAYAIAPAVAPILFAVTVFVVGMTWLTLNPDFIGTPIGVVVIPIISLTVGVVASYFVAGVIGMPIAFFLRKREILNGYTIHGAALLWTFFFVGLLSAAMYATTTPQTRPPLTDFLSSTLILVFLIAPGILLSATTFWWIVSRDKLRLSLRLLFSITTGIAVLTAILVAFFR